mgnify:CR=1 FL=1
MSGWEPRVGTPWGHPIKLVKQLVHFVINELTSINERLSRLNVHIKEVKSSKNLYQIYKKNKNLQ